MIRSELVQLWKSRVQYLRPYYCFNGDRPKQRGYPVLSRHVWFIPFILTAWWLLITVILLYKLKMQDLLNNGCTECDFRLVNGTGTEGRVEMCLNGTVCDQMWSDTDASVVCKQLGMSSTGDITRYLLALNFLLVLLWWKFAITESEGTLRPHTYKGPCCSYPMFTNYKLQYGCTTAYNNASIPLCDDWKWYRRRRRSLFTIHYSDLQVLAPLTLLLCGDIETNPGPVQLTVDDHFKITEYLRSLNTDDLIRLGGALGLHYPTMEKMKSLCNSLVLAWLNQQDNVMKRSGKPTWESLIKALRTIGHEGVARAITKDLKLEEFYNELIDVSDKWFPIGRLLGIDDNNLKSFESECSDENARLEKCLNVWLETASDCSWESLVSALEDSSVDKLILAEKLREKYCPHSSQKAHNMNPDKSSAPPTNTQVSQIVSPYKKREDYNNDGDYVLPPSPETESSKMLSKTLSQGLPPNWEASMTPSGRISYINHITPTTTWKKPRHLKQKATPAAGTDPVEQDPELPPGWEARKNKDGRTYYMDHFTKITTWYHPKKAEELGPLPDGWESRKMKNGRIFFFDHTTHSTQWEDPRLNKPTAEKIVSVETTTEHNSDLHDAAKEGNLEEVKRLIAKGLDPLAKNSDDDTTLHTAARFGKLEVIKYLTEDLHYNHALPGWHGTTPLHSAAQAGHFSIAPPIHIAALEGHTNIIKFLIEECGSDPNLPEEKYSRGPLFAAAQEGHLSTVKYLIVECKCDPASTDTNQNTLLHLAAKNGHLETVKYLIVECGCDPASTDKNQATPLHLAAQLGHLETVEYLTADRKCRPTTRNNYNQTPMHSAALKGHSDVVEYFITVMQCSPHLPGWNARSPLHDASQEGHLHLVKNLIEKHGCDPNILDNDNVTPLHLAAMCGHLSVIEYLTLNKDCNVTCQSKTKNTPLHRAAKAGHLAIVKHLVEQAHCPPNIKNDSNQTPLQLALAKGHSEVVDYLRTL